MIETQYQVEKIICDSHANVFPKQIHGPSSIIVKGDGKEECEMDARIQGWEKQIDGSWQCKNCVAMVKYRDRR